MGVIINLLLFTTILLPVLFDIGECRRSSKEFNTDVFFSYYNCKGKFDRDKIRMLASLCFMCYDGDWGAYRYRYYCSRDCFQTFTYKECLQKLTLSQKDLESIQSDFEFITDNRNFFKELVNQGVLSKETTDKTTENMDNLMVSSTSHRPEVHHVPSVHFLQSNTSVSSKNHQKSNKENSASKKIPPYKISLLGSG